VAGNVPLYIVHMSASEALEAVAAARHSGANVFAETCPQYLYLTLEETLAKPGFEGAKWVCSPPVRTGGAHHQADLWKGLRTNELACVSTDHCPFCFKEQKEIGLGNFTKIPNGMGSVEHRMDLLHQGVVAGRLSLERWVETCSVTPARMFGLYPRKGAVTPGSDADIVIYDPAAQHTLSVATHHMNIDYSAWEGMTVTGKANTVISRGQVIVDGDQYTGRKGHGKFQKRGLSQYLT
jgi:dihydropyrimidinase